MADTITTGEHVITPTVLREFTSRRPARSVVHEIPGAEFPTVTLRRAGSRTGDMLLGFVGLDAEATSDDAERVLGSGQVYTLTVDGRDTLALAFVVVGDVVRELDPDTRDAWTIRLSYREVAG